MCSCRIKKLPNEIWLMISDILGEAGHIRSMISLQKALCWKNIRSNDKFIVMALYKSRYSNIEKNKENYNEKMIDLWEKTGIDDGVPEDYILKQKDFKNKRLYRTVWASNFLRDQPIYNSYRDHYHNEFVKYTHIIFLDGRNITHFNENFTNKLNGYLFYEKLLKNIKNKKYIKYEITEKDCFEYDI